ncbi:MAG TPA: FkbM family methyltransferase [Pyrinomonadaceae bacterium]|nr:FkbM family methyltransferase [Pyrinomonadaceae bacterium]
MTREVSAAPNSDEVTTASSQKFRSASILESIGDRVGRAVPTSRFRPLLKSAYRGLINLTTHNRGLECTLPGGERVFISPGFRYVSWNTDEYEAFKQSLGPGGVALDIGANVGCYSMLFGQWVGQAGRVFAFEPAPETFAGLKEHIRLNQLDGVISPIEAAVSDQSEKADFLLNEHGGMSRLAASADDASQAMTVRVPTITVDDFCARENIAPDLIKIDVEGFELMVLRGARETIKKGGADLSVFVEMHPTTWKELGFSKADLAAELEEQGLQAVPLSAKSDPWTVEGECMRLVKL